MVIIVTSYTTQAIVLRLNVMSLMYDHCAAVITDMMPGLASKQPSQLPDDSITFERPTYNSHSTSKRMAHLVLIIMIS